MQFWVVLHTMLVSSSHPSSALPSPAIPFFGCTPCFPQGTGSCFCVPAFIYFLISSLFLSVVSLWVGQDSSLTFSPTDTAVPQVLLILSVLSVVKEQKYPIGDKNNSRK